jgi:NADH-quinone oxidoreductase subunit C
MQSTPWEGALPEHLEQTFSGHGLSYQTYLGQNFVTAPAGIIAGIVRFLRDEEQFDFLTDLTAVDRPKDPARFELIYILYSFTRNERIRIKTRAGENEPVPSITSIFEGANWLEREVYDMFGVTFTGHPNLKRILMPDEWRGFPLRKDASIIGMDNEWVQSNLGIESGQ